VRRVNISRRYIHVYFFSFFFSTPSRVRRISPRAFLFPFPLSSSSDSAARAFRAALIREISRNFQKKKGRKKGHIFYQRCLSMRACESNDRRLRRSCARGSLRVAFSVIKCKLCRILSWERVQISRTVFPSLSFASFHLRTFHLHFRTRYDVSVSCRISSETRDWGLILAKSSARLLSLSLSLSSSIGRINISERIRL